MDVAAEVREGITGAALAVKNFPTDDYFVIAIANPEAAVALGNPFDGGGAVITFSTCQTGHTVLLYTLTVVRLTENPAPLVDEAYPGTPPTAATPYRPGALQPDTRYYWRVAYSPWNACGLESSPVWSFRTGESVGVEQAGWGMVKRRYRE